jgi:hypothetical protein
MSDASDIKTAIDKALQLAHAAVENETSENYELLGDQIEELEGQSREAFQSKMDFASLLPKLEKAKPLTPTDLKTLELLIVGDAEYYLKYETELNEWRQECKRILSDIAGLRSSELDVDGLMHLRALCREARRVLPDLFFYFEQKERAAHFEAATKGTIDQKGYRVLATMVKNMLESENA